MTPTEAEVDFAARCRDARKVRGMSQHELARRLTAFGLPMHQSSVAKMERPGPDRRPVSMAEALALMAILRVPLWHYLLWWKDSERVSELSRERADVEDQIRRLKQQRAEIADKLGELGTTERATYPQPAMWADLESGGYA